MMSIDEAMRKVEREAGPQKLSEAYEIRLNKIEKQLGDLIKCIKGFAFLFASILCAIGANTVLTHLMH